MRTDDRVVIRVCVGPEEPRQRELFDSVGAVLDALPALVAHDVALEIELALIDERPEVAHAIGLEPEEQGQRRRRRDVEVVGAVLGGPRVVATPGLFHPRVERLRRRAPGPHEHQVLEEVGEAGPAGALHPRADAVGHVEDDLRNRVVFAQDDDHAVG